MIDAALIPIEAAINRCLTSDPDTLSRLSELEGKKIKLAISDWKIEFFILPKKTGIELQTSIAGDPDTTISGTLQHLFKVGIAKDKSAAMKQHKIEFQGDAHIGITMQQILSKLDIDWEELLSQTIGDAPASFVGKSFNKAVDFGKSVLGSLKHNVSDYIHNEAKLAPTKAELEVFYTDVSKLRDDVERLEAKLSSLRERK